MVTEVFVEQPLAEPGSAQDSRSLPAAASKAAHCRIRFGRRPAYMRNWPKAKLACAVPKSRELELMVE